MRVGDVFREDGEAVARVKALFDRLKELTPLFNRFPELEEQMMADPDAAITEDLLTMWVAGRMRGAKDAMRAVLGPDNVFFHAEPGPTMWFGEEPNPDWWRQFFPEKGR